jgi:heme/copper-type cytochrome/quinol oxidase subunit 2
MANTSFITLFGILAVLLACVAAYIFRLRRHIDEMHGMMAGMALGMIAGLITATLWTIPTGDFLWGVILGSVIGLIIGFPAGKLGGHMGVLEGVIAGPMGGMMGAMLGQMIRPFDLEIFMPFFSFIILIGLLGISYAVHCGVSCCAPGGKKQPAPVSQKFIGTWTAAFVIVLAFSVMLTFQLAEAAPQATTAQGSALPQVTLPGYLQDFTSEVRAEAVQGNGVQTAETLVSRSRYTPNVIVAKKGIPLKLTINADETAGCARDIIFPEFNIRRVVPEGAPLVLEILPEKTGEFPFHCSMDMARGKIIVTA